MSRVTRAASGLTSLLPSNTYRMIDSRYLCTLVVKCKCFDLEANTAFIDNKNVAVAVNKPT